MVEQRIQAHALVPGEAAGTALLLSEPLSLWGGLNPETGAIIDQHHPECGQIVTGHVLILPAGRGSSSASSILLEAIRLKTAPDAIITSEVDGILALGAVVARELYQRTVPVLVVGPDDYRRFGHGQFVTVHDDGVVSVEDRT
jgi:predicted aconitase with swiveling domain